jgi:hypothetical protein
MKTMGMFIRNRHTAERNYEKSNLTLLKIQSNKHMNHNAGSLMISDAEKQHEQANI